MAKAKLVTHEGVKGLRFHCPGCECSHFIYIESPNEWGYHWQFNGDVDRPTLSPSVQGRGCHCFVRDGRIEFLSDCSHALAGQTVELPDIEIRREAIEMTKTELKKKTVPELQQIAAAIEVDLVGREKEEDLIKAILEKQAADKKAATAEAAAAKQAQGGQGKEEDASTTDVRDTQPNFPPDLHMLRGVREAIAEGNVVLARERMNELVETLSPEVKEQALELLAKAEEAQKAAEAQAHEQADTAPPKAKKAAAPPKPNTGSEGGTEPDVPAEQPEPVVAPAKVHVFDRAVFRDNKDRDLVSKAANVAAAEKVGFKETWKPNLIHITVAAGRELPRWFAAFPCLRVEDKKS